MLIARHDDDDDDDDDEIFLFIQFHISRLFAQN